jgi:hypothetical protein
MLILPIHYLLGVYLYGRSHNTEYQLQRRDYAGPFFQKSIDEEVLLPAELHIPVPGSFLTRS